VIDADTTIDPDLLIHFDQALHAGRDWLQAYYTVANPDLSWRTRLLNCRIWEDATQVQIPKGWKLESIHWRLLFKS
jgi:hypothetical protein